MEVFNNNYTCGYNSYYGHLCKPNWASHQRPKARKSKIVNYNQDLKKLMQEVCDTLTEQGVLKILHEHIITVQSVCPSFLKSKSRAAETASYLLIAKNVGYI